MPLSPRIVKELARLGASCPNVQADDAVFALLQDVVWPEGRFANRPEDDGLMIYGLQFLQPSSHGGFWEGWQEDFSSVDPERFFPFASDDYFFYFLAVNDFDPSDPEVHSVDHEEVDAEPNDGRYSRVCDLLAALEPMPPDEEGDEPDEEDE